MKKSVKIISLILIVSICLPLINAGATQSTEQSEDFFEKYKDIAAYAEAVYPGDYTAADCLDITEDLYQLSLVYSREYRKSDFHGYLYTIDEAKAIYGATNEKVVAAIENNHDYYAPSWDNSMRYEKQVADKNGVKKDAWASANYWRGDSMVNRIGGMAFGIKDGSRIKADNNEIVIAIEYLDKGVDSIRVTYVNDKWVSGTYSGGTRVIPRGNTNEWKIAYVPVNDAKLAPETDGGSTKLCTGKEDILLQGDDMYISRIMVLDSSDIPDITAYYQTMPCPKVTYNDEVTGRTWYAVNVPGFRTFRSYVTAQSWNVYGTKFVVHISNSLLYEYDVVNETIRFLDYGSTGSCYVSPANDIYYIFDGYVNKIDWDTYEKTVLCKLPDNCTNLTTLSATTDGKFVTGYCYDGDGNFSHDIVRLNTETGKLDYIGQKDFSYNENTQGTGHPIINPVYGNLIFFCHEGTTTLIPDRLWLADTNTGKMENIFLQSYNDNGLTAETSGHEAWNKDGEYLYFVKYTYGTNKGQNGIVRIPFKDGKFTGEREYINGDAPYWHCYPSGDNNWVVADDASGKVWIMSTQTHKSYQIADFNIIDRTDPHPHFSYDSRMINWDYCIDGDLTKHGVAWADVSDITMAKTHETTTFELGKQGRVVCHSNTISECEQVVFTDIMLEDVPLKVELNSIDIENEGNLYVVNNPINDSYNSKEPAYEVNYYRSYAKATNGNRIYYDINDEYLKSVNQQLKVTFTTYSENDEILNIGYTSGVHNDGDWHKYEDKCIKLDVEKGTNTYTVDLGYVNANNICKYASDMYFNMDSGTTYIADVVIEPYYDDSIDALEKDTTFTFAGDDRDDYFGLRTLSHSISTYNSKLISVDDAATLEKEGITAEQAQKAKQEGFEYVTNHADGAWCYKTVADVDGVYKNSWFTTLYKRFPTESGSAVNGQIYFRLEGDTITTDDNNLVFIIEYLDNRTAPFYVRYVNTSGTKAVKITPTNSGKWKTISFGVTDGLISSDNSKTGLAQGTEDFRIECAGAPLYVSKVSLQKAGVQKIENMGITPDGSVKAIVKNNTSQSSSVTLYEATFDNSGKLLCVTPKTDTIAAFSTKDVTYTFDIANGNTTKLFVFEGNLKPYTNKNGLDVKVSYQNGNACISWDEYKTLDAVSYKLYCNGDFVAETDDTEYTFTNVSSCSNIWIVKAVDFYGKELR